MIDIEPEINMMVWNYGVLMSISGLNILFIVFNGYAYNKVVEICRESLSAEACGI